MKKLLIYNNVRYHYEVIESVIVKYRELLKDIPKEEEVKIFLYNYPHKSYESYKTYINNKYPDIVFYLIRDYDYMINITVYDKNYNLLKTNVDSNEKYISHEVTDRLLSNPNVYYLFPTSKNYLSADILPYANEKVKTRVPVYVIQGSNFHLRRHLKSLENILNKKYKYEFKIKLVGGNSFPKELIKYKEKFKMIKYSGYENYHREFLDCYCIMTLLTKKSHPQYYSNKLTSSINYAKGYNLKCLIDKDLQDIYELTNVEIYKNENDICSAFEKTLEDYYNST